MIYHRDSLRSEMEPPESVAGDYRQNIWQTIKILNFPLAVAPVVAITVER